MTAYDWYDELDTSNASNLHRMVDGTILDIGDNEHGVNEKTTTVERIRNAAIGVDSEGLFVCVNVYDTDGDEWALYSDGAICDMHDRQVGWHKLKTLPRVTA